MEELLRVPIGVIIGLIAGVAYMHVRFVLSRDYERDRKERLEFQADMRERMDGLLQLLTELRIEMARGGYNADGDHLSR